MSDPFIYIFERSPERGYFIANKAPYSTTTKFVTLEDYRQVVERLKIAESPVCGTCLGTPISDKPCVCGGVGVQSAELQGFRKLAYDLENKLSAVEAERDYLQNIIAFIKQKNTNQ